MRAGELGRVLEQLDDAVLASRRARCRAELLDESREEGALHAVLRELEDAASTARDFVSLRQRVAASAGAREGT